MERKLHTSLCMTAQVALISVLSFSCIGTTLAAEELTALRIAERAAEMDSQNESAIRSFTVLHKYTLDNARFNKHSEMSVRITYNASKGKTVEVLSSKNADGMQKRVFEKVIEAEKESGRPDSYEQYRVSPRNYAFDLIGTSVKDGRACYELAIHPKRRSHFLIEGKVWINKEDFAIVRMEGHPRERVSFWVGRPQVIQTFCKVGPVWIQGSTHSSADVKIAGRSEFLIESFNYKVQYVDHDQVALASAPGSAFRRVAE